MSGHTIPARTALAHTYRPTHSLRRHPGHRGGVRLLGGALRAAASAACWLLLVGSIAVLLALGVGPRTGRYRTLSVLSGSMAPHIPVGALVVDTPEPASQVRVGQVITYQIPVLDHHVVSHRVVQVLAGGDHPLIQTQGDANPAPDPWIAQITSSTAWQVRAVVPGAGRWIVQLRQPGLRRILLFGAPGLLALVMVLQIWHSPGRSRRRGHAEAYE